MGFIPVDIGNSGRRAIAWFVRSGVVVTATDADVAGHALAAVLEALRATGDPRGNDALKQWAGELSAEFPPYPDSQVVAHEHARGIVDVDVNTEAIGYGYVKPTINGHECGGALFVPPRTVHRIEPHTVWVAHPDEH